MKALDNFPELLKIITNFQLTRQKDSTKSMVLDVYLFKMNKKDIDGLVSSLPVKKIDKHDHGNFITNTLNISYSPISFAVTCYTDKKKKEAKVG